MLVSGVDLLTKLGYKNLGSTAIGVDLPTKLGYSNLGSTGIARVACRRKAACLNSGEVERGGGNIKNLHLAPEFRGVAEHEYQKEIRTPAEC